MNTYTGKLISLEGSEGAGKSNNIDFIQTREPGGTLLSEAIRNLLLDKDNIGIDPMSELLMMFASRAQLLNEQIKPALKAGKWVLCDRFVDASYAYQGAGRELGFDTVASIEQAVMPDVKADLTLYVDVDVEVGLERAGARSEPDRFELENIAFFQRVRQGYLQRVDNDPIRCRMIDGNLPLQQVQESISQYLLEFIENQT